MTKQESIIAFQAITGFDLPAFLAEYADFSINGIPLIYRYYSGQSSVYPSDAFGALAALTQQSTTIEQLIGQNSARFDSIAFTYLTIDLGDIDTRLATVTNLSRWLRTAIVNNQYNGQPVVSKSLALNQTLEAFATSQSISNPNSAGYVGVAELNRLLETDYEADTYNQINTPSGGTQQIFLNSVVDNLSGQALYGLDIAAQTELKNGDLVGLDYLPTFEQSVSILTNLKQGDIPGSALGVDPSQVVGANRNQTKIAMILQQLANTFASDDTIKTFTPTASSIQGEKVFIDFSVTSQLNTSLQSQQSL